MLEVMRVNLGQEGWKGVNREGSLCWGKVGFRAAANGGGGCCRGMEGTVTSRLSLSVKADVEWWVY